MFPFHEKRKKQTKFHQKIKGTDVAIPLETTFEGPPPPIVL